MSTALFLAAAAAGFFYVIGPGPVFLSILSIIGATGQWRKGLLFAAGAFTGDLLWLLLTLFFLMGTTLVAREFLIALNLVCGAYLLFIAFTQARTALSKKTPKQQQAPQAIMRDGFFLGILNPKSYPVAIAVFSALLQDYKKALNWENLPLLLLAAALGMAAAYVLEARLLALPAFTRAYQRHTGFFHLCFAGLFAYFGLLLLFKAPV